jgi:Tol biopolymer transport system component
MVLTASVLLLLVVFYAYRQYAGAPFPQQRSQNIKVVRFTNTGKSIDAAISPDGKFVVHVQDDAGQQSLWVKQVATSSDRQVIPPADVSYQGLAFSHDGNYICYNLWDKKGVGVIYKVPVLGGVPTKLVFDVMPSLAISPGSKHIAFVRSYASRQEQALIIADFDGTSEKTLLTRKNGSGWFGQPAWSPDGKTIACPVGSIGTQGTSYMHVVTVPSEGGAESPLSSHQWLGIGGLAWLSDGGRLIMTATDQAQSRLQIWSLSYPLGEEQKITNDVNGYGGVSLTSDSTSLVTVQSDMMSNIWVTPRNDPSRARKATSAKNEGSSLTWTPDNRIVYVSGSKSDNPDIWIMDHDGSNKKQLTDDIHADFSPSVTGDGRYIVFVSNRTNSFHLWRMRLDGSNQEQITNGFGEWLPNCSPTGNWVVYLSYNSGKQCLWKVSLDGGEPVLLNNFYSYLPAISPDGQEVAYTYWNEEATPQQLGREIISLHGAQKGQQFEIPTSAVGSHVSVLIKWASDGQALTYINNQDGISNIWRLPLDGALPQQLTDFKEDSIFWFDWSRDGEWLACSRGTITSDAILISDFAK